MMPMRLLIQKRPGDALAVAGDRGLGERRESGAVVDARLEDQIARSRRIDADAGEDAPVPRLVMARDDDDLHALGLQDRGRAGADRDARVHGAADHPGAVGERAHLAADLQGPADAKSWPAPVQCR